MTVILSLERVVSLAKLSYLKLSLYILFQFVVLIYTIFINFFGGTYMSENKKSLIDLVPDSVDNAIKNITDKPAQNMGTTFADIWYLVFGDISHAADKRRLKYSYALQEFENELKEKISKIPEEKLIEPDMQVTAQALNTAKYCVEKKELREMYANLISSSLNIDTTDFVHPSFSNTINQLTPQDAKLLQKFNRMPYFSHYSHNINHATYLSLHVLESHGLIMRNTTDSDIPNSENIIAYRLTKLGKLFCTICVSSD